MEIFTLLETLEEILEQSKKLPFTDKAIVDKEAILEVIKEIRLKLPDELKQAKWVKEERQSTKRSRWNSKRSRKQNYFYDR